MDALMAEAGKVVLAYGLPGVLLIAAAWTIRDLARRLEASYEARLSKGEALTLTIAAGTAALEAAARAQEANARALDRNSVALERVEGLLRDAGARAR